jgi:ubiquinone/menaquinone biosynthesis C-methylase UbiE
MFQLVAASHSLAGQAQPATKAPLRSPDVIFVPTPPEVVREMMKVAGVGKGDVIYDLGSGDGRIVIAAIKDFGAARGTGIDIDPQRIKEATANAQQAGVSDRVKFLNQDLFETNFSDATVISLYLLPSLNQKLKPKLFAELKPGTRIVSHAFDMGEDWKPEKTLSVEGRTIYFWTIPKK